MTKPKVDPALEAVCLPLAEDELELLEKLILRDGCQDALKVWDRDGGLVLLDGHNRLKICTKHGIPYDTSTIEIESIDEAIVWIVDNQRGRRNVATKEQLDYISGKRYEAEKRLMAGRPPKAEQTDKCTDNLHISSKNKPHKNRTILGRAAEEGVSPFTIDQNQKFAKGIDAVKEVAPDLADKILKPKPEEPKLSKKAIAILPKLPKEELKKAAERGIDGLKEAAKKAELAAAKKKEMDDYHKMHEELQEKHDAEAKRLEKQFGKDFRKMGRVCFINPGNTLEFWCNDCLNGFDTFTGGSDTRFCPYCGKENIRERKADWIPGHIGGDE